MLKMMNNFSFVYAHQKVCKIKDVAASVMEKKMCFLPLSEFKIEENKNTIEDSCRGYYIRHFTSKAVLHEETSTLKAF